MIAGEVALFALALVGVWWGMDRAVADNLYRVHRPAGGLPLLATQLLWWMPAVIGANLLLLALGERRWRRQVARIVAVLEPLLERVRRGDLRPQPPAPADAHPAVAAAREWVEVERRRFAEIAEHIDRLPESLPADTAAIETLRREL